MIVLSNYLTKLTTSGLLRTRRFRAALLQGFSKRAEREQHTGAE